MARKIRTCEHPAISLRLCKFDCSFLRVFLAIKLAKKIAVKIDVNIACVNRPLDIDMSTSTSKLLYYLYSSHPDKGDSKEFLDENYVYVLRSRTTPYCSKQCRAHSILSQPILCEYFLSVINRFIHLSIFRSAYRCPSLLSMNSQIVTRNSIVDCSN